MTDDSPFDSETKAYPGAQYNFFTPEGGQFTFRADTVEDLSKVVSDFVDAIDETEAPGILSDLATIAAAGLVKQGGSGQRSSTGTAASTGNPGANHKAGAPDWLVQRANQLGGNAVFGTKNGKDWFAVKVGEEMKWQKP